jgi:hypothetical protein
MQLNHNTKLKMQKVKLTGVQRYKLFAYIENNKETAQKATSAALAQQATLDLGFEVTPSHTTDARLQLGIRKRTGAKSPHDRLRIVCKHLQALYAALQLPIPEELVKIRAGQPL